LVILRYGSLVLGVAGRGTSFVLVESGKSGTGSEAGVLRLCALGSFCLKEDRGGEDRKKCSNAQGIHYSHGKGLSVLLPTHKQLLDDGSILIFSAHPVINCSKRFKLFSRISTNGLRKPKFTFPPFLP